MRIAVHTLDSSARKPKPADESALGFGRIFTDHLFRMEYRDGSGWEGARIVPYGNLSLDPAAMVLHYGQAVFEGLKAYRGRDGAIRLFRPEANFDRLNRSARRLCMPEIPVGEAVESACGLVRVEREWVPGARGTSLYLRPTMIATEPALGVRPSAEYLYFVLASPVGNYYPRGFAPVRIRVEDRRVRAARGGLGEAKTGANYAASLLSAAEAKAAGFDQVLWLDASRAEEIEEVGTMNLFLVLGDGVVTPPLSGSILPGVTRDSVLALLRSWGIRAEERPVRIGELCEAAGSGRLREAFGTGTAAVISPVASFTYRDREYPVASGRVGLLSRRLFDEITGIQYGEAEDRFGWTRRVI